uniref:Putative secreted protein n=1 Tax=Ixodes ricinus TaxID=34613 RepID=A0A6B0V0V9_IXORI
MLLPHRPLPGVAVWILQLQFSVPLPRHLADDVTAARLDLSGHAVQLAAIEGLGVKGDGSDCITAGHAHTAIELHVRLVEQRAPVHRWQSNHVHLVQRQQTQLHWGVVRHLLSNKRHLQACVAHSRHLPRAAKHFAQNRVVGLPRRMALPGCIQGTQEPLHHSYKPLFRRGAVGDSHKQIRVAHEVRINLKERPWL